MPPRSFVALDLETTGLNPDRDAIIEVGAVKYRDGEPVEEYSTFVNPGRPIPYEIRLLTGICDQDVMRAPVILAVGGPLGRFAGLLPIVGHNIGFDLSFLRAQGLLVENQGLDTWELASILLPGQGSYSLAALGRRFAIQHPVKHRALSDALATAQLFLHLCQAAAGLPHYTLTELVRLIRNSSWPLAPVFADAARTAFAGDPRAGHVPGREAGWAELLGPDNPLHQPLQQFEPLVASDASQGVDTEELAAYLRPDGLFARTFSGFEFRPPQVEMLGAVAGAFNNQHHLLAEAGTGTGKSVAYLLPAIAFAVRNQTRVVVSTNTINLQDQLFKKDLPDLQRILGTAWGKQQPFRAALLKGRSNYLCIRAVQCRCAAAPTWILTELRGIARILVWLPQTRTGDQAELSLPLARRPADLEPGRGRWRRVQPGALPARDRWPLLLLPRPQGGRRRPRAGGESRRC